MIQFFAWTTILVSLFFVDPAETFWEKVNQVVWVFGWVVLLGYPMWKLGAIVATYIKIWAV